MLFNTSLPKSKAYQKLLSEDFRKRIYLISYVTAVFMFIAALLNVFLAGSMIFAAVDAFIAGMFAMMGVLVKQRKLKPWIVSGLLLSAFMLLYTMTILYSGTVHGILFNYTVVPFVAFFMVGIRIARVYSLVMVLVLLSLWAASAMGWLDIAYGNLAMGMFLLSLCFSISAAWLFEHIREKAFLQSYQQSLEYDALMNAIDEVYYRVDMDGIIQKIGHGISKFTHYSPDEVIGQPIAMFYAIPEERDAYVEALLLHGKVTNYPITIKGKHNQHVHIAMNAALVLDKDGHPQCIEGVFRDVTKEVNIDRERLEHFEHLQALNRVEQALSGVDLYQALQRVVLEVKDIFAAEYAFLVPLCASQQQNRECYKQAFVSNQDDISKLEKLAAADEIKLYIASMPKQSDTSGKVMDISDVFSEALLQSQGATTHKMALLQTKSDSWLLGMYNFAQGSFNAQKDKLFDDILHRVSSTLNQFVLQKELELTVAQAEVASKAKGDFVATMSHELRTPLHGVIGLLDLLNLEANKLSKEQQLNLSLAQTSAKVLNSLIDDVLDLSKIESGNIEIKKQAFNLQHALSDALVPFVVKAREKGIDLSLEIKNVVVLIEGDVVRLRQVLLNLVGNALKFTQQGYVRIVVFQDDEYLQINIEDSGIGIDRDKQDIVFSPFVQVHDVDVLGSNLQEKGTGLGTTIAQYFVKMMGGTLTLQSEPNVGSTMSIRLPLQQVGEERVTATFTVDDFIGLPDAGEVAHQNEQPNAQQPWRILLAEDDPIGQRVVVKRLKRAGFEVEAVADGQKALEKVQQEPFDLLLTDIRMPKLGGLQLTQAIRTWEAEQGKDPILIVGLSAYAMEDVKKEAMASGMDDFVTKPVDMQALIQLLAQKRG